MVMTGELENMLYVEKVYQVPVCTQCYIGLGPHLLQTSSTNPQSDADGSSCPQAEIVLA